MMGRAVLTPVSPGLLSCQHSGRIFMGPITLAPLMPPAGGVTALLAVLLVAPAPAPLLGQQSAEGSFVHESWTVEDGLPLNSIRQVHQSYDGYIWIATLDGLVRFDGV